MQMMIPGLLLQRVSALECQNTQRRRVFVALTELVSGELAAQAKGEREASDLLWSWRTLGIPIPTVLELHSAQ